jgi:hypothetical protein
MKKYIIILAALIVFSCSETEKKIQKEDLVGKWEAIYEVKDTASISTDGMISLMMCEYSYDITIDTIFITKKIGAMKAVHPYLWSLENDSLYIEYPDKTVSYRIVEKEEEYLLESTKIDIVLKKK